MKIRCTAIAAMALTVMLLTNAALAGDEAQDKKAVQQVLERYLRSVKTADLALAAEIWAHRGDVLVVTPFGRFQGWDQVRAELYVNFLQKSFVEQIGRASCRERVAMGGGVV